MNPFGNSYDFVMGINVIKVGLFKFESSSNLNLYLSIPNKIPKIQVFKKAFDMYPEA